MGLFSSKSDRDVATWRATEDKHQAKVEKLDNTKGQDHPDTKAAYRELEKHHEDKPLRLWGRS